MLKRGRFMADQSTDLIKGSIYKSILWFSIPLLIGNLFQQFIQHSRFLCSWQLC